MTAPRLGRRRRITLDVHVVHRGDQVVDKLRIEADPDFPDDLREHLLAVMLREDNRGPVHIEDYAMRLWRVGIDRIDRPHWRTAAFTRRDL